MKKETAIALVLGIGLGALATVALKRQANKASTQIEAPEEA
jgi:uncharacterized membrane-anchored protein YhcB (DUF1043 family)